jgi:hypothetical protein
MNEKKLSNTLNQVISLLDGKKWAITGSLSNVIENDDVSLKKSIINDIDIVINNLSEIDRTIFDKILFDYVYQDGEVIGDEVVYVSTIDQSILQVSINAVKIDLFELSDLHSIEYKNITVDGNIFTLPYIKYQWSINRKKHIVNSFINGKNLNLPIEKITKHLIQINEFNQIQLIRTKNNLNK